MGLKKAQWRAAQGNPQRTKFGQCELITGHPSLVLGEEEGADDVGNVVGAGDLQVRLEDAAAVPVLIVRVVAHGIEVAVVVAAGLDLRRGWVETSESHACEWMARRYWH